MKPKLNRQKVFYWSLERGDLLPLLLMTPTLLIIFFVMILPLLYGLYLSLFDVGFGTVTAENFVGLANYASFFQDPVAQKAIWNTLLFSAGAIVGDMFFGTVGALQFEVIQYRLEHEYNASCRWEPISIYKACWIDSDNAAQLADFKRRKHTNMAVDKHGRDVFLADTSYGLALAQENFKDIRFHFTSEF